MTTATTKQTAKKFDRTATYKAGDLVTSDKQPRYRMSNHSFIKVEGEENLYKAVKRKTVKKAKKTKIPELSKEEQLEKDFAYHFASIVYDEEKLIKFLIMLCDNGAYPLNRSTLEEEPVPLNIMMHNGILYKAKVAYEKRKKLRGLYMMH
ncbi:hypothetical protein P0Y35_16130 [Kiritimatiellaeota bacterium B1221]|nr:hypothetical protein [Kiritimatiellaeota bacterium B1221]